MKPPDADNGDRTYDFALIVDGVQTLGPQIEDALFEAGCDDATPSMQYGLLYLEFSRRAASLKEAILSAIRDVRRSGVGQVLRVDESDWVSPAEIARRIGRSRQLVFQYIKGERGPGGFPPPEARLSDRAPLWSWCAVSQWLAQHQIVRPEEGWNAEVVAAINTALAAQRQRRRRPELVQEVERELHNA